MLPVVAIVGRPNVGKSSLFNRLVGKRYAIESEFSGTTRDRISKRVTLHGRDVLLVDTGGLELDSQGGVIEANIQAQASTAIEGADLVIFVLDVNHDPTADDFHAADLLRKSGKACLMVANKCDHLSKLQDHVYNFYELGFGEPIPVSAIHGSGLDHLEHLVDEQLEKLGFERAPSHENEKALRITMVGRPNVGKSSLINAMFGKEKVIVSDIPGTTRDAVEVPFTYEDHEFVLVDTAGMRRRGKIDKGIEKYSVLRSLQSVEDADIAVLVLDGADGVRAQDLHVCEFVLAQHKGLIIVVNKTDLFEDTERDRARIERLLRKRMAFVPWAPVVFTSAMERRNLFPVLDVAIQVGQERMKEVDPKALDFWLEDVVNQHGSAGSRGKRHAKVLGVKQTGTRPPRFTFKTQHAQFMHFSYKRYLENRLREDFGFDGTAIEMVFR